MMTPLAAHQLGYHVGERIPYGIYSHAQQNEPGIGTPRVAPTIRFNATLVGLATLSSEIVEDDIDRVPTFIILTPALAREVLSHPKQQFHRSGDVRDPDGTMAVVRSPSCGVRAGKVDPSGRRHDRPCHHSRGGESGSAIKPIAIALGVFGGVALLAAFLIAGQAISRRVRAGAEDAHGASLPRRRPADRGGRRDDRGFWGRS